MAARATAKKTTKIAATSHRTRKAESPSAPAHYDDLRALFLNCTLKRGKEVSHTERLIHVAAEVMRANGVHVDVPSATTGPS